MLRKRKLLVLGIVVGAVAAMSSVAIAGFPKSNDTDTGLSASDYTEITQLYGLYARDVDPGSPRNASWLFTDDGQFVCPPAYCPGYDTVVTGRAALNAFYENIRHDYSNGIRHFNTTLAVVKTKDGATSTGYLLTIDRPNASDEFPRVLDFGTYEDYLVKTAHGWRIKKRIYRADTYRNDPNPRPISPVG